MSKNWNEYLGGLRSDITSLSEVNPKIGEGLDVLESAPALTGRLDAKTCELIALAVAVTTRCEGCITFHAKKAQELGLTEQEVAEALAVAVALNAGAAFIYSSKVIDALKHFKK